MSGIWLRIEGKAEPAGSKRGFVNPKTGGVIITDANKKSKPWQQIVAAAARETMDGRPPFEGPLQLTVNFFFVRPKTVKRNYPSVRPDTTKLLRGLEDALTGIVWRDDAQVVEQHAYKQYSYENCVYVTVEEIGAAQ